MARNFYTLEPDAIYLLPSGPNQHFTNGRNGAQIEFITRHHLMYIGEVEQVVDQIWSSRQASAHHVIGPTGRWGQAVWDRDTAWANASQWANQRTIAIEHSNNTRLAPGGDFANGSWNISDDTIKTGARVAAAYCLSEALGVPHFGTNIRDHCEFTSTGCPVHLQGPRPGNAWGGKAGKYHYPWMEEAIWFYGQLEKKLVHPDGTPINYFKEKDMSLTPDQDKKLTDIHHELTHRFQSRVTVDGTQSSFHDTLVGYVLEADKKLEMIPEGKLAQKLEAMDAKLDALVTKIEGGK